MPVARIRRARDCLSQRVVLGQIVRPGDHGFNTISLIKTGFIFSRKTEGHKFVGKQTEGARGQSTLRDRIVFEACRPVHI